MERKMQTFNRNKGTCYDCGRYSHIAYDCPKATREPSKGSQQAFDCWGDEEQSDYKNDNIENCYFMPITESNQVRTNSCNECSKLLNLLDLSMVDLNKAQDEKIALLRNRRVWKLKLEVSEIEKDVLQDKIDELKVKINSFERSCSHSIDRSNQSTNSLSHLINLTVVYDNRYYSCKGFQRLTNSSKSIKGCNYSHNNRCYSCYKSQRSITSTS